MENHIDRIGNVKSVKSNSRINWKFENISKKKVYFEITNIGQGEEEKNSLLDNPIPLIRNIGSQPFQDYQLKSHP